MNTYDVLEALERSLSDASPYFVIGGQWDRPRRSPLSVLSRASHPLSTFPRLTWPVGCAPVCASQNESGNRPV